jgi:hypothetical protein
MKLVPFTVMVNDEHPAGYEFGLSDVIVGTGLLIVNTTVFDTGPLEFLTVTFAVPAKATLAAGTIAVTCVEETKVVLSAAPFHCTLEVLSKPLPFTVKVNCGDPATHKLGLIEVITGAASALFAAANRRTNGRSFLTGKFG